MCESLRATVLFSIYFMISTTYVDYRVEKCMYCSIVTATKIGGYAKVLAFFFYNSTRGWAFITPSHSLLRTTDNCSGVLSTMRNLSANSKVDRRLALEYHHREASSLEHLSFLSLRKLLPGARIPSWEIPFSTFETLDQGTQLRLAGLVKV